MPPLNTFTKSALTIALSQAVALPSMAATLTVNSDGDTSNPNDTLCTLREAIEVVNTSSTSSNCISNSVPSNNSIEFANGIDNIVLTQGELLISSSVSVNPGGNNVTINAASDNRVLSIRGSSTNVSLDALSITGGDLNGSNSSGGGIYSRDATLTITNSTVSGNTASASGNFFIYTRGGGIYSRDTTLTITNSTVSGNTASASASSSSSDYIYSRGGGIYSRNGTLTITNSTVSGNTASGNEYADARGGGIESRFTATTISNNIISGNDVNGSRFRAAEIQISSTTPNIINNNLLGSNSSNSGSAFSGFSINDGIGNIFATTDGLNRAISDIIQPLADNGGATLTHALAVNSPAINAGDNNACPAQDQRGVNRIDGACDIGAFELIPTATITVNTSADAVSASGCTLRSAIEAANLNSAVGGCTAGDVNSIIDLSGLSNGSTIALTNSLPTIASTISINGSAQNSVTISGENSHRIFDVQSGGDLTLSHLTLTNAQNANNGGAVNVDNATLTINNSSLLNNNASSGGAVHSGDNSTITLNNSTLSGNSADVFGGAIYSNTSIMTLNNSTLSGNSAGAYGGGFSGASNTITFNNTIIASNTSATANEIDDFASNTLTLQNNILGSSESTAADAFNGPFTSSLTGSSNIIGTSDEQNIPLGQILLPLENNGGPTQTHGLPASSPAINAGDNASCLTTDQRGEARDDGACDIGAVEGVVESDETMFVIPLPNGKTVIFGL